MDGRLADAAWELERERVRRYGKDPVPPRSPDGHTPGTPLWSAPHEERDDG